MKMFHFFKSVVRFLFLGKVRNIKKVISIIQSNGKIIINGELAKSSYVVKELWFKSRNDDEIIKLPLLSPSSSFSISFSPSDFKAFVNTEEKIYDLYLLVNKINKGNKTDDFTIRLGNFNKSNFSFLEDMSLEENSNHFFITKKGNVSYALNIPRKNDAKMRLFFIKTKKECLSLKGRVYLNNSKLISAKLITTGRNTNLSFENDVLLTKLGNKNGVEGYSFRSNIHLDDVMLKGLLKQDVYDLYLELNCIGMDSPTRLRVNAPIFLSRSFKKGSRAISGSTVMSVSPYLTIRSNLSIQVDEFEKDVYFYMKKLLLWAPLIRPFHKKEDIWIVGEKPYKAQDTGFHFFKYMREHHSEKNVFYVIEENSPELQNIDSYGNGLIYKSKEHVFKTLMSSRVIGSHHPDDLYPLRTKEFTNKVKAKKIFLQHGIMGTKNTVHLYGVHSTEFDTDMFIVSSDFEKSIIVNDFQYDPKQVKVTGLSRFDSLLTQDVELKRQLLIIPTWREWLLNDDAFKESEYLERYTKLVTNPNLHKLAKDYHFEIIFCLHPNMQKYTRYFKNYPIRVISQGEVNVQRLLKESAMMITDYSSVAFDFSILHKPILYYQFDRARFLGKRGSHLDLDNDLPGDVVYDELTILNFIECYAKNDFKMKEDYVKRASKFLKYRDLKSSERIYNEIVHFNYKKPLMVKIQKNRYVKGFLNRYRKSRFYFPTMKLFFKTIKTFVPIKKELVVFESGIGKQFSDSPKAIYEELLKRGTNFKFVWVYNSKSRFSDKNTIQIKRLSPQYFYYLGRAAYWVNNQNFPTYLQKRKKTTYVQTWHGTPLKKMLFDIENIQGRTEDYLERVYGATKTWDYLISPSSYATNAFKSAFRYTGNIIETGYPRNDIFYNNERDKIAANVRRKLNIPKDKKVILYAPTFRDNQTSKTNKFLFDLKLDLEKMKQSLNNEYVLLLRMHVLISNNLKIDSEYNGFVYNVSNYSDIQELYLITDVLITDYSSVMFDFANTKKPILFFTYDLEEYRDQTRGFYMDFEQEAPGPLVSTTDEVIKNLQSIKEMKNKYKLKYKQFHQKYCSLEDGQASKRVVDIMLEKQKNT